MAHRICAECKNVLISGQSSCPVCGCKDTFVVAADQANGANREDAERELAMRHYEIEEGLTQIFRITDKAEAQVVRAQPIKLLEVNTNTVEAGVMPLHFGPAPPVASRSRRSSLRSLPSSFRRSGPMN